MNLNREQTLSGRIHHQLKTGHHYWRHMNLNREQTSSGRIHHKLKTGHHYWRHMNLKLEQTLSGRIHHKLKTGHHYWRHMYLNREQTLSGQIHHQLKTDHHYWRYLGAVLLKQFVPTWVRSYIFTQCYWLLRHDCCATTNEMVWKCRHVPTYEQKMLVTRLHKAILTPL